MEQFRINVQSDCADTRNRKRNTCAMTISPMDAAFSAWAAWFVSWMVAALWSSRVEHRSQSVADLAHRLLTIIGAVLLFDLHLSWNRRAVPLWQAGGTAAWALVAMTIS